jgi:hypothetical protein
MDGPQMMAVKPLTDEEFEIFESHVERIIAEDE